MTTDRMTTTRGMTTTRCWQVGLLALGIALLVIGGLVLFDQVSPKRYLGILMWFAGAIVLHDGIVALITFAVGVALRKTGRHIPIAVLVILQGAIVVGAIVALIVFPEIYKKSIGTNNPTVLPLDYGFNLAVFYAVLVVLTALVITGYVRMTARRQKLRPSSSQT